SDNKDKTVRNYLEDLGVTVIEAVGKEFDPNLHNAVMHVEDETVDENIIVEEFQKGYKYKETVVRHSMVKVAN
ncbi:MAG: nucleotide exchange factor GrpE, partial [Fusicatenibacter sp.]